MIVLDAVRKTIDHADSAALGARCRPAKLQVGGKATDLFKYGKIVGECLMAGSLNGAGATPHRNLNFFSPGLASSMCPSTYHA